MCVGEGRVVGMCGSRSVCVLMRYVCGVGVGVVWVGG